MPTARGERGRRRERKGRGERRRRENVVDKEEPWSLRM